MKILATATATFEEAHGGASRYFSGCRDGLTAAGETVIVRTTLGRLGSSVTRRGVLGQASRMLRRGLVVYPGLVIDILRERPDVVVSHFPLDGLAASVGAALIGVPLVSHFHGPWALEAEATGRRGRWPLSTRLRRRVEVAAYRRSAAVITLSEAFAGILRDELAVDPARIRVIPGALDPTTWHDVPSRSVAREALVLGDAFTVLSVRRLTARMGLDLALRAVANWDQDRPVCYLIIGEGEARRDLETLAGELGLGGRVRFLGAVSDETLRQAYAAADVTLMPTRSLEGFGYAALESLAVGVPVVATAVGGLAELVGGLSQHLLVEPDASAIGAKLRDVCQRPDAYPDAAACRAYADGFGWPAITQRVLAVYREVAARPRGDR